MQRRGSTQVRAVGRDFRALVAVRLFLGDDCLECRRTNTGAFVVSLILRKQSQLRATLAVV